MAKIKQVIIIRKDLKMRRGKECAQSAHASLAVLLKRPLWKEAVEWIDGDSTKIVLQINSEEELLSIYNKALDAGLPAALITDKGYTEFNEVPTNTCVAIGPADADAIDVVTGKLKPY